MAAIRLLLVDDHVLFRESLSRLLQAETDLEVVADVGSADDALALLARQPIDLVLLDFDLGPGHGSGVIAGARGAGSTAKFLMVTAGMTAVQAATALRLGASGIFLKHSDPSTLVQAIRLVAGGTRWVDAAIVDQLAAQVAEKLSPADRRPLTDREHAILEGVFEGLANKEIGARLQMSESAVKAALQALFRKTDVRTRGQLVRVALERALLAPRKT
jgi:DNA-binding NarL/FixJ family response regulator